MILFADIDGVMHAGLGEGRGRQVLATAALLGSFARAPARDRCGYLELMAGDFDPRRLVYLFW